MNRFGPILVALTTAAFVISSLLLALRQMFLPPRPQTLISYPLPQLAPERDLLSRLLQPDTPVIWVLMLLLWAGLGFHAVRILRRHTQNADTTRDLVPLAMALLSAAIWPWSLRNHPVISFFIALIMLISALVAAMHGWRERGRLRGSVVIAGFAGWATALFYASFATLLTHQMGFPVTPAAVVAILLCTATGIAAQIVLGSPASYAAALIWAFAGVATATMASQPAIAISAAICIAALGGVLVRAAS